MPRSGLCCCFDVAVPALLAAVSAPRCHLCCFHAVACPREANTLIQAATDCHTNAPACIRKRKLQAALLQASQPRDADIRSTLCALTAGMLPRWQALQHLLSHPQPLPSWPGFPCACLALWVAGAESAAGASHLTLARCGMLLPPEAFGSARQLLSGACTLDVDWTSHSCLLRLVP